MQTRAGERDIAEANGRILAEIIPEGARPFLGRQRMIVLAHSDDTVWASIRFGDPGFVFSTRDGKTVRIEHGLSVGVPIGLLAIDFVSRRRLRVNGVAESADRLRVREAYPNCPKYIQRRTLSDGEPIDRGAIETGSVLDAVRLDAIRRADTAFVASRHPERGMDASHRGGPAGFIAVRRNTLVVPDYAGNGMFNSLGNFLVDPAAGMTIVDFDRGRVLEMTGKAAVAFDGDARFWSLDVAGWRELPVPPTLRWSAPEPSPYNP